MHKASCRIKTQDDGVALVISQLSMSVLLDIFLIDAFLVHIMGYGQSKITVKRFGMKPGLSVVRKRPTNGRIVGISYLLSQGPGPWHWAWL